MRTIIHRSSALRASTDAYGAGILRMLHIFYLMVFICDPLILALSEKQLQAWHPDRGARFLAVKPKCVTSEARLKMAAMKSKEIVPLPSVK